MAHFRNWSVQTSNKPLIFAKCVTDTQQAFDLTLELAVSGPGFLFVEYLLLTGLPALNKNGCAPRQNGQKHLYFRNTWTNRNNTNHKR
jgi:hypothetical protein